MKTLNRKPRNHGQIKADIRRLANDRYFSVRYFACLKPVRRNLSRFNGQVMG